jgi:hypothetical protein
MEEQELIRLWKEQDAKIEQSMRISNRVLRELTHNKARKELKILIRFKSWGIVSFVLYLLLLVFALKVALTATFYTHTTAGLYFIISVAAIIFVNVKGMSDYIRHLVMANAIDYNCSVVTIQQQLAKIQLSILRHSRFMFLQVPFYTTIYLSDLWFPSKVGWVYIIIQVIFTGVFVWLAIWFYRNHTPENLPRKKWLRNMVNSSGGKYIEKALVFYNELEEFKDGDKD